jgi:hypothetical protein
MALERIHYNVDGNLLLPAYFDSEERYQRTEDTTHAHLVSSELSDSNHGSSGLHAPTLDLDMEASLIPSSTPGRYHLYIDHPLTWRKYKRLLRALARSGIIEKGFVRASIKRKRTQLRTPTNLKSHAGH